MRGVVVAYGDDEVLHGVDLEVRSGETLVVLGANGAGKTTLLRTLAGTLRPARGEVLLEGTPLAGRTRADVARAIAVVPQDVPRAEGFRARDVVAMGRAPHQGRWLRASRDDDEIVERCLDRCGATELAERAFDTLSGGERRRVLLAQALAQQPRVLLLDEPSAFLDLRHAVELFDLVAAEAARGLAVVANVHDLGLAARYADRVALLRQGRLVAVDAPDVLLVPSRLADVLEVDLELVRDATSGATALVPRALVGGRRRGV